MKTEQFLLRPNDALIKRLKNDASKYKRGSGQQVALEVIEHYLEFWEKAEDKKLQEIKRQRESLDMEIGESNGEIDSGGRGKRVTGRATKKPKR